jgi:transcriptional regulator with XRE-family HTH domain
MARRARPDPLAAKIGARVRALRQEANLTMEGLAYSCDFSKGQLSTIEKGLAIPSASTLVTLAEGLGVLPLDLLTFPRESDRERVVDATRSMSEHEIRSMLKLTSRS